MKQQKFITALFLLAMIMSFYLGFFWQQKTQENRNISQFLGIYSSKTMFNDLHRHFIMYKRLSEKNILDSQQELLSLIDIYIYTLTPMIAEKRLEKETSKLVCKNVQLIFEWFSRRDFEYGSKSLKKTVSDALALCKEQK